MSKFRADLHIHTLLSPCGDLEMSPDVIIARSKEMKLDIIGITDHNCTRQCNVVRKLGELNGIKVLCGAEVTTKEEVHCLVFFESDEQLIDFQKFLDDNLPGIPNDTGRFGYQVVVNEENDIVFTEERLLLSALLQSIEQVEAKVHSLNGLFIPAHIDKKRFGVLEQLGFLPADLRTDALELSPFANPGEFILKNQYLKNHTFVSGSDAHYPHQVGDRITILEMEHAGFENIRKVLLENLPGTVNILC